MIVGRRLYIWIFGDHRRQIKTMLYIYLVSWFGGGRVAFYSITRLAIAYFFSNRTFFSWPLFISAAWCACGLANKSLWTIVILYWCVYNYWDISCKPEANSYFIFVSYSGMVDIIPLVFSEKATKSLTFPGMKILGAGNKHLQSVAF